MPDDRGLGLAYAHANMRLRTRYKMEITKKEWEDLGRQFREGRVDGAAPNHVGDIEGWVKLNGQWVAAYYNVKTKCIKTFFARPPDFNSAAADKMLSEAQAAKKAIIKEAKALRDKMLQEASAKISQMHNDLAPVDDRAIIRWYKRQIHDALSLLNSFRITEAVTLLAGVVSLPSNITTPQKCEALLAAYFETNANSSEKEG